MHLARAPTIATGVGKASGLPRAISKLALVAFIAAGAARVPSSVALIVDVVALNVAVLPLAVTMWNAGEVRQPEGLTG